MFISILELFKIGIGPSSSHTMGPMSAAAEFLNQVKPYASQHPSRRFRIRCTLKGSLAWTGKGHSTDRAVMLGLHGYFPESAADLDLETLIPGLIVKKDLSPVAPEILFSAENDIIFDRGEPLPEHPNGMIFELLDEAGSAVMSVTRFSIGGGFLADPDEIEHLNTPMRSRTPVDCPWGFKNAAEMLQMANNSGLGIAQMKQANELARNGGQKQQLEDGVNAIIKTMMGCVERGLRHRGELPGGLAIKRRASVLYHQLRDNPQQATVNDWLSAYAMAVNEENAAGHQVVTAPTNGAAGVIPAVLYYFQHHQGGTREQLHEFLLTAAAIGGLIKHNSSISGAEVGCQGEVGSAASMAAAGLCAAMGGTPAQVENAAEIALEHHLGMTCDPVNGLVQVPCIERNAFGAIKAFTAASLALRGDGEHFMPLDNCIAAMKITGQEMSDKYKETSLGGLAVSLTEC